MNDFYKNDQSVQNEIRKINQERHHEKVMTFFNRLLYSLIATMLSISVMLTYYFNIKNDNLIFLQSLFSFTSLYFVLEQNHGIFFKFSLNKNWFKRNFLYRNFLNKNELEFLLKQALIEEDYLFAHKLKKTLKNKM